MEKKEKIEKIWSPNVDNHRCTEGFDDFLLYIIPIGVTIGSVIINEGLAGLRKRSIIKNCLNKGIYPLDRILNGGETSINRYRLIIDVNG